MPKKTVRKRRSTTSPKKKSSFLKFFSFKSLAVFAFIGLALITVFMVAKPDQNVLGVTASDDMAIISEKEANAIAAQGNKSVYTVHQVNVFIDDNKTNAKFDEFKEECYFEKVTLYADNGNRVRTFDPVSGCSDPIRIRTKTRSITIGIKPIKGYKNTGLTYTDKTYTKRTIKDVSKVKVTGFPYGYPATGYYTFIEFGIKKK